MSTETRQPPSAAPQPPPRGGGVARATEPAWIEDPAALLPIVDDLSDGLFTLDAEGHVVSWSAGAERITGYPQAEASGKSLSILCAAECRSLERAMELLRDPARKDGLRRLEFRIQARDGRLVQVLGHLRTVRDRLGRIQGAVGSLSELTGWVLAGGATLLDIPIEPQDEFGGLVGRGDAMQEVFRRLRAATRCDLPVLLRGEPGTGRSHAARLVHTLSMRREGPLQVVECAGRAEGELAAELFGGPDGSSGRILAARGGTLILEEVHELTPVLQERLLELSRHTIARRPDAHADDLPSDVRVVATAGDDLDARVDRSAFLAELRAALRGLDIPLPPLRERRIDIPLIVRKLSEELGRARGIVLRSISREALEALVQHPWPENVRQLRLDLERTLEALTSDRISLLELPAEVRGLVDGPAGPAGAGRFWTGEERLERARLVEALERHHWNRTRTARELGISRVTLWKRIRRLGLETAPGG